MRQPQLIDIEPPPDVFAAVMATGIVSIAADAHGYSLISDTLAVSAALALTLLVAWVLLKTLVRHAFPFDDVRDPDVALRLFTFVAACAVLAARLQAHPIVTWALGVVALAAWLLLVPIAARGMWPHRWVGLHDRAHGAWELASVATSGLAIVAAVLALHGGHVVLLGFSGAMWILAIVVYCLMTWLILWRAATAPEPDGRAPDSWILMGGLAIATLAGDHIHRAARSVAASDWLVHGVRTVTVMTWVLATLWIPPLVYAGLRRINRRAGTLRFAGVWWAMVFPLGMYSAATHAMALETGWPSLRTVSLVFFWIALTAWLIVTVGGVQVAFVRWRER